MQYRVTVDCDVYTDAEMGGVVSVITERLVKDNNLLRVTIDNIHVQKMRL